MTFLSTTSQKIKPSIDFNKIDIQIRNKKSFIIKSFSFKWETFILIKSLISKAYIKIWNDKSKRW